MDNKSKEIIFEQNFSSNIPKRNQRVLLNLIKKISELTNTLYPINGVSSGELINLHMRLINKDVVYISGFYSVDVENRCIQGEIYTLKDKVYIDTLITRIGDMPNDQIKEYRTLDIFTKINSNIEHSFIINDSVLNNSTKVFKKRGIKND
jgi:hypothetical protein